MTVMCCSLKLECEKLAQEKTEIQRQYIMVSHIIQYGFIAHKGEDRREILKSPQPHLAVMLLVAFQNERMII